MTESSFIHPRLRMTINSLDLDIAQEIAKYKNHRNREIQKYPISNPPRKIVESQDNLVTKKETIRNEVKNNETEENDYVIEAKPITSKPPSFISSFTTPWGIASLILTVIGSSLLGLNLNTNSSRSDYPATNSTISSPEIVEGVDLSKETVELNLKTVTKMRK